MNARPPSLLPILRSGTQAQLLTALFMEPEREFTLSELAALVGTSLPTATREVARAERAGIVTTRQVGRSRLVRTDTDSYVHEPLRELLLRTFGPVAVVADEFSGIDGIDRLFIFGSWAAAYEGVADRPPRDIDVLVIGRPERDAVHDAAERTERRLHQPVQATIRMAEQWEHVSGDPFLREVRSRPLVEIDVERRRDA